MSLARNRGSRMKPAQALGRGSRKPLRPAWAAFAALAFCACAASSASAGDLILTGAKPDHLFVIDAAARTVRSDFRIPGANGIVGAILVSPDQKTAYVLVDRMERIVESTLRPDARCFAPICRRPRSGSGVSSRWCSRRMARS